MTAAGMTSVSVSFETRRQLNSMKVMDNHRSIDDMLADLVKQYKVLRMRGVVDDLRARFSELEEMDVDALVRKLAMSPFAV